MPHDRFSDSVDIHLVGTLLYPWAEPESKSGNLNVDSDDCTVEDSGDSRITCGLNDGSAQSESEALGSVEPSATSNPNPSTHQQKQPSLSVSIFEPRSHKEMAFMRDLINSPQWMFSLNLIKKENPSVQSIVLNEGEVVISKSDRTPSIAISDGEKVVTKVDLQVKQPPTTYANFLERLVRKHEMPATLPLLDLSEGIVSPIRSSFISTPISKLGPITSNPSPITLAGMGQQSAQKQPSNVPVVDCMAPTVNAQVQPTNFASALDAVSSRGAKPTKAREVESLDAAQKQSDSGKEGPAEVVEIGRKEQVMETEEIAVATSEPKSQDQVGPPLADRHADEAMPPPESTSFTPVFDEVLFQPEPGLPVLENAVINARAITESLIRLKAEKLEAREGAPRRLRLHLAPSGAIPRRV